MKISGLLWALLFAVGGAEAAGLGKLSVQSALGQPLKAEIELLSVNKDELPGITARLAGADAFRQARINRTEVLATLRFSVDQRANGQPVIRVSSSVPIADPFLDMLIEVNWNSGRLLREYTVLLDPPAEARATAPVQPVTAPEAARPAPPAAAPERRVVAEPATPRAPEAAPARQPRRYGPVQGGETLRGIAGKVKRDGVTLEQMMVGLYQANRDAFFAGNVNRLKRGQVLNVPDAETVHLQVSPAQAARTLQSHAADWHAYRRKVAEMAGEAPLAKAPEAAAGKLAPKAEEKTAPAAAAPRDMLKLSKGEPGSAGRPDGKVQEKLHALEEELASRGRSLQEAQDRVGQLERTVHDMQKLLELKAQETAKVPAAPVKPGAAVAPEVPSEPVAPVPPVVAPKESPAPVVLPAPVQQPSASWISTFISNPLYIGGIVAAVLLSVLLWMMMVGSRRRQGLNKFEDSIMTGGEFKNNAVFNAGSSSSSNAGAGANTEGSMLLTDFSRLGLGAIDTHEVDPIAEAEVYMAYGRDAQAEEILKEALNKDPNRHEIALKLLEIYAARKDSLAFETVASELYAGLGGQGTPVWQRAAEMGRSIDPSNPLYRATASDIPAAPAFSPKSNGRSIAPEAAPRSDFPHDMQQMGDWDAPTLSRGSDEDFDIPVSTAVPVAPLAHKVDAAPDDFAPMSQPPQQEEFTAPSPAHDFALEFEPAVSGSIMAVEKEPEPIAEHGLSWDEFPVQVEELEAAPVEDVDYTLETLVASEPLAWKEAEAGLEFADAPAFDEVPEEVEAMPVLDLSGIDLEMEVSPELESEIEAAPETVPPVHIEAAPRFEMPAPVEVETVAEAFVPADDFAPDMVDEFVPSPIAEPAPAPVAEPELETPPSEEVADPELWEEVNTKLDLARAYLEMGDKEGAREILQEVLGEGDALQKSDADKLLAEAG